MIVHSWGNYIENVQPLCLAIDFLHFMITDPEYSTVFFFYLGFMYLLFIFVYKAGRSSGHRASGGTVTKSQMESQNLINHD